MCSHCSRHHSAGSAALPSMICTREQPHSHQQQESDALCYHVQSAAKAARNGWRVRRPAHEGVVEELSHRDRTLIGLFSIPVPRTVPPPEVRLLGLFGPPAAFSIVSRGVRAALASAKQRPRRTKRGVQPLEFGAEGVERICEGLDPIDARHPNALLELHPSPAARRSQHSTQGSHDRDWRRAVQWQQHTARRQRACAALVQHAHKREQKKAEERRGERQARRNRGELHLIEAFHRALDHLHRRLLPPPLPGPPHKLFLLLLLRSHPTSASRRLRSTLSDPLAHTAPRTLSLPHSQVWPQTDRECGAPEVP
eukprot:3360155-Rhodomonas_salina.4